jgi:hypothetical protein
MPPAAPAAPKVSFFALENLLSECRQWADSLHGNIEAVQPLMKRRREMMDGPPCEPARVEELAAEAALLRDQMRGEAAGECARRLRSLRTRIDLFMQICVPDEELKGLLGDLELCGALSLEEYAHFSDALKRTEAKFGGTANVEQEKLHESLLESLRALRVNIAAQRAKRRTLHAETELLEIGRLLPAAVPVPPPADDSLAGLELCADLERRLETARLESMAAARSLDDKVTAATLRHAATGRLREVLGMPGSADFEAAGELLKESSSWLADAIVDDCQERLKVLDNYSTREERACEAHAAALTTREVAYFRAAERELTQANCMPFPAYEVPGRIAGTPDRIAAVEALAAYRRRVDTALTDGCAGYRQSVEEIRARMRGVISSAGPEANREIAEELLEEALSLPMDDAAEPLTAFQHLRSWVQQCETFFYTLEREQSELRTKVAELKAELHGLRRQSRNIYLPALFDRVVALVGGAALGLDSPSASLRQLEEASALLVAVQRHSLGAIVVETEQQCRALKEQIASSRDVSFTRNALRVLDDIAALEESEIPPLALRRELGMLTRRPWGTLGRPK